MKVLFDHHLPFALAHGGFEHQLVQTKAALESIGVQAEHVRWWDPSQQGDIIHFFGRPTADYISFAHGKNYKVIVAELLTATGSRSRPQLALQKISTRLFQLLPSTFTSRMAWDAYRLADACIALTAWEAHLMHYLFGAPENRVHVVPNGVENVFFDSPPRPRGQWLVCTATITERKRVLELATAAVAARTPLWVIGRAYSDTAPYVRRFLDLARANPEVLRYDGGIADRPQLAQIYREARGFVLLSAMESLSLSALEAAACGCPLLLGDLPWARSTFGAQANYCPLDSTGRAAECLKQFYADAPGLPAPARPATWQEVGQRLKKIYETL